MRIMNKHLAVIKALTEKGFTVDQLVENSLAQKQEQESGKTREKPDVSRPETLDPKTLADSDMVDLMKSLSENYKLEYKEDLYVPGQSLLLA